MRDILGIYNNLVAKSVLANNMMKAYPLTKCWAFICVL